jgi:hypothetical protein
MLVSSRHRLGLRACSAGPSFTCRPVGAGLSAAGLAGLWFWFAGWRLVGLAGLWTDVWTGWLGWLGLVCWSCSAVLAFRFAGLVWFGWFGWFGLVCPLVLVCLLTVLPGRLPPPACCSVASGATLRFRTAACGPLVTWASALALSR